MKGIVPPMPMYIASLPKKFFDADDIAAASHGAVEGAFQPSAPGSASYRTFAPYGGSFSNVSLSAAPARSGSTPGRNAERQLERRIRPQHVARIRQASGMPSTPVVIDSVGRQVLFNSSSAGSLSMGCMPSTIGSLR